MASALAGWAEFLGLRNRMRARVGDTGLTPRRIVTLWGSALLAGALGLTVEVLLGPANRFVVAAAALGAFGVAYLVLAAAARDPVAIETLQRVRKRRA